jgi:broad specificity phosphatase PhoE
MTIVYLIRHGQVDRRINPADPPLSTQGQQEAIRAAAYLEPRPIARVYASPLRRAQETAASCAAHFGLPVLTDARLRERANFGDIPGQTLEEFVAFWERGSRERDWAPPGGQSSRATGRQVESFMAEAYQTVPDGEVVAVGHGGAIADFLLNILSPDELAQIHPGFAAQPYAAEIMRNGAITVVEYRVENGTGRYKVHAIALAEYLV